VTTKIDLTQQEVPDVPTLIPDPLIPDQQATGSASPVPATTSGASTTKAGGANDSGAPVAQLGDPQVQALIPGGTSVQATKNPVVAGVSDNELVSGNLNKLLAQGSPYLEKARSDSLQMALGRGLQNSSIAAGAGEAAAIGAALPIAQGDAQVQTARTTADLAALNNAASQQAAADANINQILTQGDVNTKLQASANAYDAIKQKLEQGFQLTLTDKNFQNQQALAYQASGLDIAKINQQHQNTLEEIAAQAKANQSQFGPQLQTQYLAAVSNRMQYASQEVASIYQTQGLSSEQQQTAVSNAYARMQSDIAAIQSYYKQSPLWDPNFQTAAPSSGTGSASQLIPTQQQSPTEVPYDPWGQGGARP